MDRLEAMSLLLETVDAGSLSAAGRRLGMPLATISRKVSDLEKHLKTRLLSRSSRHLALTDAGRSYVEAARRILEDLEEAERAAAGEYCAPKGDLIVTAPVVFGRLHVLPVVTDFLKAYPDIDIRLVLADRIVHLLDDHVDVAVRIGHLPDSNLVAARVGLVRRVICASSSYLAARGSPQVPDDLRTHDCITFEGLTAPDVWSFGAGKAEISVPVHSRFIVNTAEAAIDAAIAGAGLTRVLSYQIRHALRANLLAVTLQDFEPAPWPINLVHAGGRLLPLKLRAFLDFAVPRLKAGVLEETT
jgi:DNA-binding transcriptional LysR family regulator